MHHQDLHPIFSDEPYMVSDSMLVFWKVFQREGIYSFFLRIMWDRL